MGFQADGLIPTTAPLQALGSWPGPVTHGRGDAVSSCLSSRLGQVFRASSSSETRLLLPFDVNQRWSTSLCRAETTAGGRQKQQLVAQPHPRLPAPLPRPMPHWHLLHLPSPPTGNDTGQISEVHMSWTVSLGILWASSLLYVSYLFHSKHFFF